MKREGRERITFTYEDLVALGMVHADEQITYAQIRFDGARPGLVIEVQKVEAEVPA